VELYVWLLRSMASGPGVLLLLTAYSGSERLQIWIRILLSVSLFCPNIMHVKLTDHTLTSQMYFFFKYDKSATNSFSKLFSSSSCFSGKPALIVSFDMSDWTIVAAANHHHDDDGIRHYHGDRSLVPMDDSGRIGEGAVCRIVLWRQGYAI
jgi:hypothetical protein